MTKNNDYWAKRALLREEESAKRTEKMIEAVRRQYEKAAKQIAKDVRSFILKYGKKHGLSYDQATQVLSRKEMQEWKKTLAEFVEDIKTASDPKQRRMLKAQLDALSANASISRLEALLAEIHHTVDLLQLDGLDLAKEFLGETFTESYYKKIFDIQSRVGRINDFAHIDEGTVQDILSYPWSGAKFSDRLWRNKENLCLQLEEALTNNIIQGTSTAQLSKELSDAMGKGFKTCETLLRTESAWIHGEADKRAYDAAGVEEYEFMATLEHERTCKYCGDLDGEHFPVEKAQAGVNYPPLHPRCRCTTIEYDPEDALDWYSSGVEMPKNMTYEEWHEQFIKEPNQKQNIWEAEIELNKLLKQKNVSVAVYAKPYDDITDVMYKKATPDSHEVLDLQEYAVGEDTYTVDGKNVVLDYSDHEKDIAVLLEKEFGGEIYMVPRVNYPQGIRTPDYLFRGEKYDLKTIEKGAGENTVYNRIKKAKKQATRFIVDTTASELGKESVLKQIEKIFTNKETKFVEEIILVSDKKIIKVLKRK